MTEKAPKLSAAEKAKWNLHRIAVSFGLANKEDSHLKPIIAEVTAKGMSYRVQFDGQEIRCYSVNQKGESEDVTYDQTFYNQLLYFFEQAVPQIINFGMIKDGVIYLDQSHVSKEIERRLEIWTRINTIHESIYQVLIKSDASSELAQARKDFAHMRIIRLEALDQDIFPGQSYAIDFSGSSNVVAYQKTGKGVRRFTAENGQRFWSTLSRLKEIIDLDEIASIRAKLASNPSEITRLVFDAAAIRNRLLEATSPSESSLGIAGEDVLLGDSTPTSDPIKIPLESDNSKRRKKSPLRKELEEIIQSQNAAKVSRPSARSISFDDADEFLENPNNGRYKPVEPASSQPEETLTKANVYDTLTDGIDDLFGEDLTLNQGSNSRKLPSPLASTEVRALPGVAPTRADEDDVDPHAFYREGTPTGWYRVGSDLKRS